MRTHTYAFVHAMYSAALCNMFDQLTDICTHLLPQSKLSYLTHTDMRVMSRSVSVGKTVRFVKTLLISLHNRDINYACVYSIEQDPDVGFIK